jgi:hypothetical protein
MFVKPAPNPDKPGTVFLVRVPPHMRPLPIEGAHVPDTLDWHRAVMRGDVVVADPPGEGAAP